ncbi:MAG: class I SAM-dependent methyltransferase [Verrucomicrobia bacterium]|nr:class I SAM-dependent methyltransferase [Verrucomicrobiota bacterium]
MSESKHLPYEINPKKDRNHYYETLWKEVALDLLQKHEPDVSELTLLDYGCGRGETMDLAARRGMKCVGTDLDPHCVELAEKFGEAKVLDVEDPVGQFGENSFDVVVCFHVLEHVPRPLETLIQLRKIARKYVIVAVPNLSRSRDFIRRRNWDIPVNEGHLQSWDHSHWRNMAENHAGLEVLEWGFDATVVLPISNIILKIFGQRAAIRLETGLFRRLWPYGSISVISLMRERKDASQDAEDPS